MSGEPLTVCGGWGTSNWGSLSGSNQFHSAKRLFDHSLGTGRECWSLSSAMRGDHILGEQEVLPSLIQPECASNRPHWRERWQGGTYARPGATVVFVPAHGMGRQYSKDPSRESHPVIASLAAVMALDPIGVSCHRWLSTSARDTAITVGLARGPAPGCTAGTRTERVFDSSYLVGSGSAVSAPAVLFRLAFTSLHSQVLCRPIILHHGRPSKGSGGRAARRGGRDHAGPQQRGRPEE